MARILTLAIVLLCAGAFAGQLDAQMIPLALGNEWSYKRLDRNDTVTVRIVGSGTMELPCGRRAKKSDVWFDNEAYYYAPTPGGVMIYERRQIEQGDSVLAPVCFAQVPAQKGSPKRLPFDCAGTYTFIGLGTAETPAGIFENCLMFDDQDVHRMFIKPGIGIVREERYMGSSGKKEGIAGERVVLSCRVLVRYSLVPAR